MRKSNLVKLYEGVYVDFTKTPTAFSVTTGTTGEIGLMGGGIIDVSKVKPNRIYDAYINYGYCTNNEITIYNSISNKTFFEILALSAEDGTPLFTETTDNFLVTEYNL
jgi:hypothetical protein